MLNPVDIFSLVALTAYHNNYFGVCSRAFVKLETLPPRPGAEAAVQNLALKIFTKHSPLDPAALPAAYIDCLEKGTPYTACTATGRLIEGRDRPVVCRVCRYSCLERAVQNLAHCPLCHTPLDSAFSLGLGSKPAIIEE